jgi:hypothetical protein
MKNAEDIHLEKISEFLKEKSSVFILESGNYSKAKKITEYCLREGNILAVPSFNNELTLRSLLAMFFPSMPRAACDEAIKIIENTDEGLYSVFKKISILSDSGDWEALRDYFARRRSFMSGLDQIPLIRLLLQTTIKEKIIKSGNFYGIVSGNDNATEDLLKAELTQKSGFETGRGYIYRRLIPNFGASEGSAGR